MSAKDVWDEDWMQSMVARNPPTPKRRVAQLRFDGPPRLVQEDDQVALALDLENHEERRQWHIRAIHRAEILCDRCGRRLVTTGFRREVISALTHKPVGRYRWLCVGCFHKLYD